MIKLTPQQKMATARILACKQAPFLQRAILALIPIEDDSVIDSMGSPTFGVTDDLRMRWHPEALDKWTPEETAAVLLHEVSHPLRDHSDRFDIAKKRALGNVSDDDRTLWNQAADMEINDDLVAMGCQLPGEPCLPKAIDEKDGGLAETYFEVLLKQRQPGQGQGQGKCCAGHCGSGAGNPLAGDPPKGSKKKPQGGGGKNGTKPGMGDGGQAGRSAADIQRVKLQVAEDIQKAMTQGRGRVPAGWAIWADDFIKPAKVRWQDKLSRIVRGVVHSAAGLRDYSYARPSRRQGAYGWGMGSPILPALRGFNPRVAVGVDTSGSMGTDGISRAASELANILKTTNAEIDYIACDCEVHVQKKVRSISEFAGLFKGGGGTSFVPAFEAVEKMKPRPHVFIFITDGDGYAPQSPPHGVQVIWVLCGRYQRDPGVPWGEKISIDETDSK